MDTVPNLSHPFIPGAWHRRTPEPPRDLPRLWRELARGHPDPLVPLRLEWVLDLRASGNLSAVARRFGVSRKALAKWRSRFALQGVDGLAGQSRAPLHRRGWSLGWQERERIRSLKTEFPCWGRLKLSPVYAARFGTGLSLWQFQRAISRYGLQWRPPRKRARKGEPGFRPRVQGLDQDACAPGELWHLDTVELRLGGQKRYLFTALEHATRQARALVAGTKHSRHAATLARALREEFPQATQLHSDNGSEFRGEFLASLPQGAVSWVSRPRTPTDNARLERLNRTVQEECFADTLTRRTLPETAAMLAAWERTYNETRPHAALGGLAPACYARGLAPPA